MVFNNQDSVPLSSGYFPRLRKMLERQSTLVLPQDFLDVHPDYISNETQVGFSLTSLYLHFISFNLGISLKRSLLQIVSVAGTGTILTRMTVIGFLQQDEYVYTQCKVKVHNVEEKSPCTL